MIELRDVTMRYGPVVAVDRASMALGPGEIVGLLGPNGAGKTTTMRIITTFLTPEEGTVRVAGIDALADPLAVRRRVGYLPEVAPLYPDMQVRGYLRFVARARGVDDPARIEYVIDACGLEGVVLKHIRELSRGYRQRVGLAQALIHDPQVLVLDEPTAGLDPFQVRVIRELIRSLAGERTILLSTHVLAEAELVAGRAVVIHRGRIVADGPLDVLERQAREHERVEVELRADGDAARAAVEALDEVTGVREMGRDEGAIRLALTGDSGADLRRAVGELAADRGWAVLRLHDDRFTLEETFVALTRGSEERA